MDKEKVLALSKLSRVEIGEMEAAELSREFGAILDYVSEIKGVVASSGTEVGAEEKPLLRNIMRADGEPHVPGLYTEDILAQAPEREGDYVKVKKIL